MRIRVLIPLIVAGAVAIVAMLIPAAMALATNRTQALLIERARSLSHIVQIAELAMSTRDTDMLVRYLDSFTDVYGEAVAVVDAGGRQIAASGGLDAADPGVAALAGSATRNLPQLEIPTVLPWAADRSLIAQPILSSGETAMGAVVLQVDQTRARADVGGSWLLITGAGAVLLAALAFAALRLTRWVLRPVSALDAAANGFPATRFAPEVSTGPPELRRLAASFARMAAGVERTMSQQRDFVADASHQLRNPLAAIRLRVDGLGAENVAPERIQAVDADLDRLESTVDRMLELATAEHRATVNVSGTVEEHVPARAAHTVPSAHTLADPFRGLIASAGQTLVVEGEEELRVPCPRSDLEEIAGTLLDNARRYAGPGATVRLRLARTVAPAPSGIELSVSDDGPGLADDELASAGKRFWRSPTHRGVGGTGLGLAIVEQLAAANGATTTIAHAVEGGLRVSILFPEES